MGTCQPVCEFYIHPFSARKLTGIANIADFFAPASSHHRQQASTSYPSGEMLEKQVFSSYSLSIMLTRSPLAPILGDEIYSKKKLAPSITEATQVPPHRLFLHASEVSFFVGILVLSV